MLKIIPLFFYTICLLATMPANAQLITGYWKGKIGRRNVELKIIKNGDSLTGTSYYFESPNRYSRYSIKGYFSSKDNSVAWWDDRLIEEKGGKRLLATNKQAGNFSTADFNCPGGDKMYLDGEATLKETTGEQGYTVALEKQSSTIFKDEWNYIIDNYTFGANDPELIDSIDKIAFLKPLPVLQNAEPVNTPAPADKTTSAKAVPKKGVSLSVTNQKPQHTATPITSKEPPAIAALTNEEKFTLRSKKLMQEIPITGDTVELRFYDNAEVDGDSIAIFLNNQLLYEHIRLTDKAYTIQLSVAALQQTNELVMVAENLGSIPPNTSLMVMEVNGKRYEARLESTEYSSALIRFIKPKEEK